MILPPQYVSSTKLSLTVKWGAPAQTGGCPLQEFDLFINDGQSGPTSTLVNKFDPSVNQYTITGFTNAQTSLQF